MSGKTERLRRAVTKANLELNRALITKQRALYGQFILDAKKLPFKHRWTLAWAIIRCQRKIKQVKA